MLIKLLVLHLSKRLKFNAIKTLTYKPEHIQQIILGTNGSGKSSLMSELSPLPANPSDYYKGGYKLIHLEHKGREYELLSDFGGKSNRHSFKVNGNELNDGGTITVQRQLVKEHFDFDQDLFDLLTGITSFREMNPNQRREWLVRMADDNMEYAIAIYNKTRSQLREAQSITKYLGGRLSEETAKVPNLEDQQGTLKEKLKELQEFHTHLQRVKSGIDKAPDSQTLIRQIEDLTRDLHRRSEQILNKKLLSNDKLLGLSVTLGDIMVTENTIKERIVLVDKLKAKYLDVEETVNALVAQGAKDIESLESNLHELESKQRDYYNGMNGYEDILELNPVRLANMTDTVAHQLRDILTRLPDNTNGEFSRERLNSAKETLENGNTQMKMLSVEVNRLEHLINHYNNSEMVECPNCHTEFNPKLGGLDINNLKLTLAKHLNQQADIAIKVEEAQRYLSSISEYRAIYGEFTRLMENTSYLSALWKRLGDYPLNKYPPNRLIQELNHWVEAIDLFMKAHELNEDIGSINEALSKLRNQEGGDIYNQKYLLELEEEISHELANIAPLQEQLVLYKQRLSMAHEFDSISDQLEKERKRLIGLEHQHSCAVMHKFLSEELQRVNVEMGVITIEINQLEVTNQLIADLTRQRQEASNRANLLSILADELSPSNGLIADHSLKFVKQFTDQMNEIINTIWTYDMQLLPVAVSDDLTYKFPLYMAGSDTETPDINKASTAQKGVIDFAFKILLITYLGLEDYPLYIDELTPNLDETHRINIMTFVKNYVEARRCSQMFMISHYVEGNNVFPGAEFVVINDSNLLNKPDFYNTNVTFEYE